MTNDEIARKLRPAFLFAASTQSPDASLRRPPVPQRAAADYSGDRMVRYIGGLQTRLIAHVERHAPKWHAKEAERIRHRWDRPSVDHPAPSWAPRRDVRRDANEYAASLLQERLVARLLRVHDLRVEHGLDLRIEALSLHQLFDVPGIRKNLKLKM